MNSKPYFFFLILPLLLFFTACTPEPKEIIPDVSAIEIELKVRHFEKDFFSIDTNNISPGLAQLESDYPVFSPIYFQQIIGDANFSTDKTKHEAYVNGFLKYPGIQHLYDTCSVVHGDFEKQKVAFEQAFKYLKHYFPDLSTPDITTFTSEYGVAAFIYGDNSLAVGLDFFLGSSYPYFRYNLGNSSFSQYLTHSFTPEHLATKTLQVLIEDLAGQKKGNRMLDNIVHNGKKLYLLDKIFPHTADSIILEIPQKKVDWLQQNEADMWAFFLSEDLLYAADYSKIKKYISASPNSPGMPEEAPGKTGNWIGYQIIKHYMRRHPQTTMYELIEMKDAQAILAQSKYKPRQ